MLFGWTEAASISMFTILNFRYQRVSLLLNVFPYYLFFNKFSESKLYHLLASNSSPSNLSRPQDHCCKGRGTLVNGFTKNRILLFQNSK